jgi:hypothetical protein
MRLPRSSFLAGGKEADHWRRWLGLSFAVDEIGDSVVSFAILVLNGLAQSAGEVVWLHSSQEMKIMTLDRTTGLAALHISQGPADDWDLYST